MDKPYNRCLYCPKRLANPSECDGPRTSGMPIERWREYMRDLKEVQGLTYEDIANRSNGMLSFSTVQNVLAPGAKNDVTRETARLIENAIFDSSNAHPCPVDILDAIPDERKRIREVEDEMKELRKNIEFVHASYRVEMDTIRKEAQVKIDHLKSEISRLEKENDYKKQLIDRLLK